MNDYSTLSTGDLDFALMRRLPTERIRLLERYTRLLLAANEKVNLVSRATAHEAWERHILHALALSMKSFPPGARVVDWGTGGGLPAVPLAIAFPDVQFIAVDSTAKKVRALEHILGELGLGNVTPWYGRADVWPEHAHYSISRGTASLFDLWRWHLRIQKPLGVQEDGCWAPGLLCLKGGDLLHELSLFRRQYKDVLVTTLDLSPVLGRRYLDKLIVQVQMLPNGSA